MPYAVHHRRRVRPWTAVLTILAVLLAFTVAAANNAAAQSDRRPTAARTSAPPGPATVTYSLTGALGQPLAGVQVTIHQEPNWEWTEQGTTDAAGRVTFDDIPEGPVGFTAAGRGNSLVPAGLATLVAGTQTVPFSFALGHGEVSGTLENAPVLGDDAWSVCTWDGSYSGCVPYDRNTYSFAFTGVDALPVGSYDLVLVPWYGEGGVGRTPVGTVTVTAGSAHTVSTDLAPFVATIRGTITGTNGLPFAGTVSAGQGNMPRATAPIGTDGTYEVEVLIASDQQTLFQIHSPTGEIVHSGQLDLAGGTTTVHDVDLSALAWATVRGTVRDASGAPLAGVAVWLCHELGCRTVVTGPGGTYTAEQVAIGVITADPWFDGYVGSQGQAEATADGETVALDLSMRRLAGLPPNVDLSGSRPYGELPALGRTARPTLSTTACAGGTAAYGIDFASTPGVDFTGALSEDPVGSGRYATTLPAAGSYAGLATITLTVTCPDGSTATTPFDVMYIDPSGTVLDTDGKPIDGAKVVLQHSDSADGPFTDVPDGSDVMSPANRVNPWTTGPDGTFKWDVVAGYYRLQVSAPGYQVPGTDDAVLTTEVWRIPPEVVGLELVLERAGGTLAEPTVTVTAKPAKAAVGKPVTLRAAITGSAGRPTGSVDFSLDGEAIAGCQGVVVADGVATCTTTPRHAGRARVGAAYGGDAAYAAGTGSLSLTIAKGRQSVVVSPLAALKAGVPTTVTVSMKNSGLTPRVTNLDPSACSLSTVLVGSTLRVTTTGRTTGHCELRVTQPGNADWYASDVTLIHRGVYENRPKGYEIQGLLDQTFNRGLRTLTGIKLSAGDGGDMVCAYVYTRDKSRAKQRLVSLTGGGWTWYRGFHFGTGGSIQEQWCAYPTGPVKDLVVKATLLRSAPSSTLWVAVSGNMDS